MGEQRICAQDMDILTMYIYNGFKKPAPAFTSYQLSMLGPMGHEPIAMIKFTPHTLRKSGSMNISFDNVY